MQDRLSVGPEFTCRRAVEGDFEPATELLNRFHIDRLSAEERRDGFISALFTPSQLREMAEEVGVFIAASDTKILACLCCYDSDSAALPSPYRTMRGHFAQWIFRGKPLSAWHSFAYGPVCIDASARGKGLLRQLFAFMVPDVRGRYQVGTAFIAKVNQRSLAAHVDQLAMTPVGDFRHADQDFVALAFALD